MECENCGDRPFGNRHRCVHCGRMVCGYCEESRDSEWCDHGNPPAEFEVPLIIAELLLESGHWRRLNGLYSFETYKESARDRRS